jgi:hypothetical protein
MFTEPAVPHSLQTRRRPCVDRKRLNIGCCTSRDRRRSILPACQAGIYRSIVGVVAAKPSRMIPRPAARCKLSIPRERNGARLQRVVGGQDNWFPSANVLNLREAHHHKIEHLREGMAVHVRSPNPSDSRLPASKFWENPQMGNEISGTKGARPIYHVTNVSTPSIITLNSEYGLPIIARPPLTR